MYNKEFSVITGVSAYKVITSNYKKVVDVISNAYIAHFNNNTINPNTYSLKFKNKPDARINALPAYIGENINIAGIKWISSFPQNIYNDIPRASAVVILNDYETGFPISCLEGSVISAARTAASAVAGTKVLNNHITTSKAVSFIGCGLISKYILNFLIGTSWNIDNIYLYDLNKEYAEQFSSYIIKKYKINVVIVDSIESVISNADILYLATTATTPYIYDEALFKHNPLVINISLRDIAPNIMNNSINIVDDVAHCLNSMTSMHLTQIEYGNTNFIKHTIGELLAKKNTKINRNQALTIYSPFGMGILDIALGYYIYNELYESNDAIIIDNFFEDKARW